MNNKHGFTVVEVLIASTILILFLGGGFALYIQGQGTINKNTWINNSTRDEGIAVRELAELTKRSSYPSRITADSISVNEDNNYKAKCPAGVGNIALNTLPRDILAFPVCVVATSTNGSIEWVILRLTRNPINVNRCNLDVVHSTRKTFSSDPGNSILNYSNGMAAASSKTILRDIESVTVTREATDSARIEIHMSSPKSDKFKKNVLLKIPLNVAFN